MIKSILKRSSLFIFTVLCLSSLILPFSLSAAGESNTLEASIAADVASGRDIAQIIQSAIAGGMSLEDAIGAIIKAGAIRPMLPIWPLPPSIRRDLWLKAPVRVLLK